MRRLRRYSFSILVVGAALAVGALIYFAPTRFSPAQESGGPAVERDDEYSTLSIYSTPAGASVIVGADTVGMTPIENHRVPSGTYLVTVEKEDYVSRDTAFTLAANQSVVYTPQLRQEEDGNSIAQNTSEAQPTTEDFGTDPTQEEQQAGGPPQDPESDVGTSSGTSQEQDPSPNPPADTDSDPLVTGSLSLRSNPGSTSVTINGYEVGSTPLQLNEVAVGTHEVTFNRTGYEAVTKRVEVTGDGTVNVKASLDALMGRLRILVHPWGSIYINGERHAEDSDIWYETDLQPGTYTIIARHPSLGEKTQVVEVAARDTQSVVLNVREQ